MKLDFKPMVKFLECLPKNGDVELSLLKTHLLIEEVLTKIITDRALNPEYIEASKLQFHQKVNLAKAFSHIHNEGWLWGAIKKLNNARNKLSHNLSNSEISEKIEEFICFVESEQTKPEEPHLSEKFGRFHFAIFQVFTKLSVYSEFDWKTHESRSLLQFNKIT